MNDFETIEIFDDYVTANFAKQRLDDNGINCYLADENTITAKWILKNALGGIKLRVLANDRERALIILKEESAKVEVEHTINPENKIRLVCPKCGSDNIGTERFSKTSIGLSWLLLGFPFSFKLIQEHRCFYCDHKWET